MYGDFRVAEIPAKIVPLRLHDKLRAPAVTLRETIVKDHTLPKQFYLIVQQHGCAVEHIQHGGRAKGPSSAGIHEFGRSVEQRCRPMIVRNHFLNVVVVAEAQQNLKFAGKSPRRFLVQRAAVKDAGQLRAGRGKPLRLIVGKQADGVDQQSHRMYPPQGRRTRLHIRDKAFLMLVVHAVSLVKLQNRQQAFKILTEFIICHSRNIIFDLPVPRRRPSV
ncbi:hypothetical protein SDC9_69736 [bioreactor metagenome]|uniref:Uncharacterized protein n=1 Tax=bioreactor metagenome TaxID=1076179 RepID=A0A644Y456_9ZZZZ